MHHPSPIMAGNYYNVVIIHKQKVRLLIYLCLGMGDRGKHEDLQMAIWMSMQHTTPEPFKKRKERNILQKMKKRVIMFSELIRTFGLKRNKELKIRVTL